MVCQTEMSSFQICRSRGRPSRQLNLCTYCYALIAYSAFPIPSTFASYASNFAGKVPFSLWSSHRSHHDAGHSDLYAMKNYSHRSVYSTSLLRSNHCRDRHAHLAARLEVLALGVDALVVVDVVLPAVLRLILVREAGIEAGCKDRGG